MIITLEKLIRDARRRSSTERSTFITDEEITELYNIELAELWGHLTQGSGQPFFRSQTTIAVTSGIALYALPADYWQSQEVNGSLNGVSFPMDSFGPREHGRIQNRNYAIFNSPVKYRIQAENIEFQPASQTFTVTLYYTPTCPELTGTFDAKGKFVSSTSTFQGFNRFEAAAIYGVVATIKAKEDTDPTYYVNLKERIYRQIDSLAATRDAANPERVQDVMGGGYSGDDC